MTTIASIDFMNGGVQLPLSEIAEETVCQGDEFAAAVSRFRQAMESIPALADPVRKPDGGTAPEPATVETLKTAISENARLAAELPVATVETLKTAITENTRLAAELPAVTVETLKTAFSDNRRTERVLPSVTVETLKTAVAVNQTLSVPEGAAMKTVVPETTVAVQAENPVAAAERPVEVAARPEAPVAAAERPVEVAARPEAPVAAAERPVEVAARPEAPVATVETLKDVVKETLALPVPVATKASLKAVVDENLAMQPDAVVLQAAPMAVPEQPAAAPNAGEEGLKVGAVTDGRIAEVAAVSKTDVLIEAANAVADTMIVSPGLMRGEGEIVVTLKPDVLAGSELRIAVAGGQMTVEFTPTVANVAQLLVECQPQLVQYLSERISGFQIAVNVKRSVEEAKQRV